MIGNDPRYQAIIDAYKAGQLQTTAPQYNPIYDIRTEQIKAGELPPGSRFPNPQLPTQPPAEDTPEEPFDPCPPGYQLIDGVCQPDTMFDQGGGDGGYQGPEIDRAKLAVDKMAKDPTIGYGASSILDDYISPGLGEGTFVSFDPSIGRLGSGSLSPFLNIGGAILDPILGLPLRRENLYNQALDFMLENKYGKKVGNDLFKFYSPTEYFSQVAGDVIYPQGNRQGATGVTVADAVRQLQQASQASEGGGAPIAEDLSGGLLYTSPLTTKTSDGKRVRNEPAYRAALARNVKANPTKFRSNVGGTGKAGFIGGR